MTDFIPEGLPLNVYDILEKHGVKWCPSCGEVDAEITTTMESETLKYGMPDHPLYAELPVVVPVRKCGSCGIQYLDSEAEDIHTKAIQEHLARHQN